MSDIVTSSGEGTWLTIGANGQNPSILCAHVRADPLTPDNVLL